MFFEMGSCICLEILIKKDCIGNGFMEDVGQNDTLQLSNSTCPHILPILRPCRPPSSNLEHPNALKLRLHRSHANLLHVVPLPLLLHRIPCHHIPNRPLLSLTLQVSRSLLRILPTPPPSTLSPLHSPPSLILRYRYLTPLLVVAPLDRTQIPFFQHSYPKVIPLGYNKLVLHL